MTEQIGAHRFEVGMKLEAVNPALPTHISPATIISKLDKNYFLVEIDNLRPGDAKTVMCCHSNSPYILPARWCHTNGVRLSPPVGTYAQFDSLLPVSNSQALSPGLKAWANSLSSLVLSGVVFIK